MKGEENKQELLIKLLKGGKGSKKSNLEEITNFLRINHVDLNLKNNSTGYSPLYYAIQSENPDLVNLLLTIEGESFATEKADPNQGWEREDSQTNALLETLLINADPVNCAKIIKSLIKAGGDIYFEDYDGCTIFHRACEKGRIDIIEFLVNYTNYNISQKQFDINQICKHGGGLHMAIIGDQDHVVTFLLDKKINLNLKDSAQNTALHLAIQQKTFNQFKQIIDHILANKDIYSDAFKHELFNAQNEEGNTILHELAFAKSSVLIDFIKKFKPEYAVDVEIKNKEGYTYKGVQDNIIQLQKQKIEIEKTNRDIIRKEKEKILEEKRKEEEEIKKEQEKDYEAEEKQRRFGETLLKYRCHLFVVVFVILMVILWLMLKNAANKKKPVRIIL